MWHTFNNAGMHPYSKMKEALCDVVAYPNICVAPYCRFVPTAGKRHPVHLQHDSMLPCSTLDRNCVRLSAISFSRPSSEFTIRFSGPLFLSRIASTSDSAKCNSVTVLVFSIHSK